VSEEWRQVGTATPIPVNFDEVMLAFLVDVCGCAGEPLSRGPKPRRPGDTERAQFTASSADEVSTSSWLAETTSLAIRVEWTNEYFPGDVNEPPRGSDYVVVEATRRGRPARVRVGAYIGAQEMSVHVDATPEERDQIFTRFSRSFGP
jgi:hypothetical protein